MDNNFFSDYLKSKLSEYKLKNKNFSLRSLAKKIKINSGDLSLIINKKRNVSYKKALQIIDKIEDDPCLKIEVKLKLETIISEKKFNYSLINEKHLDLLFNLDTFSFLSLVETNDFIHDREHIANRLGVSVNRVNKIINNLLMYNYIKFTEDGKIVRTFDKIRTSDDKISEAVKKLHLHLLDKTSQAIQTIHVDKRDCSAIVMPVNVCKISEAKKMIRKFQEDMSSLLEDGNKEEVYSLAVSLIPLSKSGGHCDKNIIHSACNSSQ